MGETAKTRNNQIKDIAFSAITQLFRNWSSVCEYENVEWGGKEIAKLMIPICVMYIMYIIHCIPLQARVNCITQDYL